MLRNMTAGNVRSLLMPILYTTLANLVAILPFGLLVEAARVIILTFAEPGAALDFGRLWWLCGALAASQALIFLCEIPAYRSQYRSAYSAAAEGRSALAEHIRKLPLGFLGKRDPGDLAHMMMDDYAMVEQGISHHTPQLIGAVIMPVLALLGLSLLDWRMAAALFASMPMVVVILALSNSLSRRLGASHLKAKLDASNRLQEYLSGMAVMKAYNLTGDRFVRLELSFRELMRRSIRLEGLLGPIVLGAVAILRTGLTVMVVTGTYLFTGGSLDLVTFATFLIVGSRLFDPLTAALANYAVFRYTEQAGERILGLFQTPVMDGDKQPPAGHDIELKEVDFGYGEDAVLKKVSLSFPAGSLSALVGPSGSGKSTVLRLIARFYDPGAGEVTMGGHALKEMEPEALLRNVSMVFQDVYLFQDTIANNIAFGKSDSTMEDIVRAARLAKCHDFILRLPEGYETKVGEGGSTLSGGEKQRISIARAILKEAPVILLDEATASLDPENEADIQQAINSLVEGRTVIVIAHRLKTVRDADQIIVLDGGEVQQCGTHDELLAEGGLYARLWNRQREAADWKLA